MHHLKQKIQTLIHLVHQFIIHLWKGSFQKLIAMFILRIAEVSNAQGHADKVNSSKLGKDTLKAFCFPAINMNWIIWQIRVVGASGGPSSDLFLQGLDLRMPVHSCKDPMPPLLLEFLQGPRLSHSASKSTLESHPPPLLQHSTECRRKMSWTGK